MIKCDELIQITFNYYLNWYRLDACRGITWDRINVRLLCCNDVKHRHAKAMKAGRSKKNTDIRPGNGPYFHEGLDYT